MTATLTQKLSLTKVGYLIVYVKDVEASAKWYSEKLGIPAGHVEKGWGELQTQGFTLALHGAEKALTKLPDTAPTVVFSVDDIRATRAALVAAGVTASELHSVCEFDGKVGVSTDFVDLDGNRLSAYGMLAAADWKK